MIAKKYPIRWNIKLTVQKADCREDYKLMSDELWIAYQLRAYSLLCQRTDTKRHPLKTIYSFFKFNGLYRLAPLQRRRHPLLPRSGQLSYFLGRGGKRGTQCRLTRKHIQRIEPTALGLYIHSD